MGYVVAAYAISALALGLYAAWLHRNTQRVRGEFKSSETPSKDA